ncbi:MAG: metal-dependent transcriptional regulator [Candidatus Natronoplasma sp.]
MLGKREEEYLETIYDVVQAKGYAKVKDIAEGLDVGLSSVTEMFQKLDKKGYIDYKKYSGVTLTNKGEEKAVELSEKHEVLKDFFIILGMDEELADEDACKIEHVVRRETMERLTKFVDFIQSHEKPLWLERFKKYYETGEMEECPKTLKDKND